MTIKALATPLALLAGLAFGTGAFAQTTVGTITVSDEDLPHVQSYCEDLAEEREGVNGDQESDDAEPSPLEEVQTDVDLTSITISDCEEAGLIE